MLKIHAIGAAVCVTLAAVGYFFGLQPLMHGPPAVVNLGDDIDFASQELEVASAQLAHRNSDLVEAQRLAAEQSIALSPASTLNARLVALSELAQTHDLSVTGTQVDPLDETGSFAFIPVKMGGEGTYADATRFIGDLRIKFPDMGMTTFSLLRDGLAGGAHFELELNWYVVPPQSAQVND